VPILSAFAGVVIGTVFGLIWPSGRRLVFHFGELLIGTGAWGAGIFGVVVRG